MKLKSRGEGDLYHRYRPKSFAEIVGQDSLVSSIRKALTGSAFLLIGPSGTGKTTTARIMALSVNCETEGDDPCLECGTCLAVSSGESPDVIEMNAADTRGIDSVRSLVANMHFAPMVGKKKVYILDECHQLTSEAQNTLLKNLEDAPSHVLMILCSTDPKKILKTVRNRCQTFKFSALSRGDTLALVSEVASQEGAELAPAVLSLVVDVSEGSPRKSLVALQQVLQLDDPTPEAAAILLAEGSEDESALKLCFALTAKEPRWDHIVKVYEEVKHLGAPLLGMTLAGYFRNKLLNPKNPRFAMTYFKILKLFLEPMASGKLGENQLVYALFHAFGYTSPKAKDLFS